MGTFIFRWPYPADHVYVTGDFDDWGKSVKLDKVGDVFEKEVHLSKVDAKIYYKFVVNDQWIVDENAPKEDDGHYNVNNVLRPDEIKKTVSGEGDVAPAAKSPADAQPEVNGTSHLALPTASAPPESDSGTSTLTEAPVVHAGGEGAPLVSLEQSEATPDPDRSNTRAEPETDGASASQPQAEPLGAPGAFPETPASDVKVDPIPATGHSDIQSSVTTSKEDYENAGGEGTAGGDVSVDPIPATGHQDTQGSVTTSKEDYEKAGGEGTAGGDFSVNPIPATGHLDTQGSVTTSQEDYEKAGGEGTAGGDFSVNPIPATGHLDTQSSVTTSKEDYEKAGALGTAGAAAAVAGAGAAIGSAFSKPNETDQYIIPESSLPMNPAEMDTTDTGPFISSAGPGTTTADLAAKVPLEPKREAQVIEPGIAESDAAPFITSSGPGTTTADLAAQVPLEQKRQGIIVDDDDVPSPEIAAEKSAVEEELLQKVPESQAAGEPASAAAAQSSYHGLAPSVPETVEESMVKADAAPEAAADASVVAEKSAVERELHAKVPVEESAGEPAPTLSAATASTAPESTSAAAAETAATLTDGKTANEAVPDTDTTAQSGASAGEIAGGAAVGGAAAAGAAALAAQHEDKTVEPPQLDESQKPSVTTEAAPATTADDTSVASPTSGGGDASRAPGVSPTAGAALSDGTEKGDEPAAPTTTAPVEKSEATDTEYAPPRKEGTAPGVSPTAAAALSDGTEDPTAGESQDKPAAAAAAATASDEAKDSSAAPETPKKAAAGPAASTTSTPAKSTPGSAAPGEKKKKRHRISQIFKKIFD